MKELEVASEIKDGEKGSSAVRRDDEMSKAEEKGSVEELHSP